MSVLRFFIFILLATFTISIARPAAAQDDPNFETGMKPFGAYNGGNIDAINLFNGAQNIDIPLISYPQRGGKLKLDFHLRYADVGATTTVLTYCFPAPIGCTSYAVPSTIPGWCRGSGQPANDVQLCHGFEVDDESGIDAQDITSSSSGGIIVDNASIIEPSGATHTLLPTSGNSNSITWESVDGTAFQRTTGTGSEFYTETITGPDGTMYDGASFLRQDTNGNAITYSSTVGWTDTLSRVIPPIPAATSNVSNCPQPPSVPVAPSSSLTWNLPGVSGGTYPVTLCFIEMSEANPIGLMGSHPMPYTYTGTELQSVVLPNGTTWTFEYTTDGNADLAEVIFPTGGSISYGYTTFDAIPNEPDYHRAVTTRTLNPDDGITPASTWNYTYSVASSTVTTVVSAPPSTGTTQDDSVHTFAPFTLGAYTFALGYESAIQYYQGSHTQGSLLKTTNKQYSWTSYSTNIISVVPETVTNVWANGQQAETTYTYDTHMSYYPPDLVATSMELLIGQGGPLSGATYGRLLHQYDYDFSGSLLRTTTNTYLAFNNSNYLTANVLSPVAATQVTGSGPGSLTDYGYDAAGGIRGNLTSTSRWLNTTGGYLTTSNVYDSYGRVTSTTDPKNNTTTYGYGSCYAGSGPTSVTNALNKTTSNCYDATTGLLTSTTDPNNQTTSYTYDDMFRTTLIRYPDGGSTAFTYPTVNDVDITEAISSSANRLSYLVVDGLGREIRQAVTNGESEPYDEVDTCYNGNGLVSFKSYPFQDSGPFSTPRTCSTSETGDSSAYDALKRTTSVTHSPDGSSVLTSYTGRATSVQDEGNGTQRVQRISQIDGLGRLASVCEVTSTTLSVGISGSTTPAACGQDIAATGFLTTYGYDVNGNLTSVTQGPLNARSFVYDSLSRLTSSTNPESGATSYTYDADGNVATKTDARSITTTFSYDQLNRVLSKVYSDGTAQANFQYDAASNWGQTLSNPIGRLTEEWTSTATSDPTATIFSYDPMGRVALEILCTPLNCPSSTANRYHLNYAYDLLGDTRSSTNGNVTAPVTLTYAYNVGARLTSITSNLSDSNHPSVLWGKTNPVHYNAAGSVVSGTFGNGIVENRYYDGRLRLCNIKDGSVYSVTIPSSTPSQCSGSTTGYAPDGDILAANDSVNGNWTYGTYDGFNRLTGSSQNSGATTFSYVYDRFGNRWSQTATHGSGPSPSYGFDANNHIVAGDGVSYDAAGNVTGNSPTYFYDAEDRLIQVGGTLGTCSTATACYIYDAEGRRWNKNTGGVSVDYLYDLAGHEIAEANASAGWNRTEVYAADRHVATYSGQTGGTTYFIHKDWLGTERARTNVAGTSYETCTSLPFGDLLACAGTDISPMHFTGKQHDSESGLDYFGARYDSSAMGRFMSPDWSGKPQGVPYATFDDPQSLNLYAYTQNDPVSVADKDGHCIWDGCVVEIIAGVAVVSAISYGVYKFTKWVKNEEASADSDANKNVVNDIVHPNEHPDQDINAQTTEIQNSTLDPTKQATDTLKGISAGASLVGATSGVEGGVGGMADKVVGAAVDANNKAVEATADAAAQSQQQKSQANQNPPQQPTTPLVQPPKLPQTPPSQCSNWCY